MENNKIDEVLKNSYNLNKEYELSMNTELENICKKIKKLQEQKELLEKKLNFITDVVEETGEQLQLFKVNGIDKSKIIPMKKISGKKN